MLEVQNFNFNNTAIRVIAFEQEPWFVAADVAKILGYSSSTAMTRTLEDDEKGVHNLHTPGGEQATTIINEPGLYSAILRSRRPEAKQFKRWVTHEVLPAIRKHGGYLTPDKVEEALLNPDTLITLANRLKEERAAKEALAAKIAADQPKILLADAITTAKTSILIGDLAKILKSNGINIGANRLFARLRDYGYLISRKGSDWNSPTQRSIDLGLFEVKETAYFANDGHTRINKTTKVTGKGQQYFISRFLQGVLTA